jgi:DHA1 family bicyclomycin/chloramphenicol resistance-like MFS transporter
MSRTSSLAIDSRVFILLLGLLSATAPLAIDMYLPAIPTIAWDMGVSIGQIQQTLTVFMLGFAGCQLVYGPLSDRFGRRPILLFGTLLFLISSLLCITAQSVEQLYWLRLLQALGGGATSVVVMAVVRDLYQGEEAARMMSLVIISMTVAPLLAPLVGGQLLEWFGWRSIFLALGLVGLVLVLMVWLRMPETHPASGRQSRTLPEMIKQYGAILCHRQALSYLLCSSFSFAGMFAFISGSPFVYIDYFDVSPQHYGLLFGSNILLMVLCNWVNSRWVERVGLEWMILHATWVLMLAGVALLCVVLSGLGGLWGIFPLLVIYVGVLGLIGANTAAGFVSPFGQSAGSASALLGAVRFLFGALASAVVAWLHDGTPLPMAMVIAACGVLAFICYRWLGRATIESSDTH